MKRSNAHEVTLRAGLGMLFTYLCPHLVRRQMLKTLRASRTSVCVCVCVCVSDQNRASVPFTYTDTQNMQNSYLNSLFAA